MYTAEDMGICGTRKSGMPSVIDYACTNPKAAGDQLLPCIPGGNPESPDESIRPDSLALAGPKER